MLDPAWLRIDLPVFFLSDGNDARVLVKHHEARAGCALIDGSDVIFQGMRQLPRRRMLRNGRNWRMGIVD